MLLLRHMSATFVNATKEYTRNTNPPCSKQDSIQRLGCSSWIQQVWSLTRAALATYARRHQLTVFSLLSKSSSKMPLGLPHLYSGMNTPKAVITFTDPRLFFYKAFRAILASSNARLTLFVQNHRWPSSIVSHTQRCISLDSWKAARGF